MRLPLSRCLAFTLRRRFFCVVSLSNIWTCSIAGFTSENRTAAATCMPQGKHNQLFASHTVVNVVPHAREVQTAQVWVAGGV